MTRSVEPDVAGFANAQVFLREKLGRDVPFFTPTATVYPSGTAMDPETGRPYDPAILPEASGFTSAVVRCSVVNRPMGLSRRGLDDDTRQTAAGILESREANLIVTPADYEDNNLDLATRVRLFDEEYEILQAEQDAVGPGAVQRYIVYLKGR